MRILANLKSVQSGKNGITVTLSDVEINKEDLTSLFSLVDEKIIVSVETDEETIKQMSIDFYNV